MKITNCNNSGIENTLYTYILNDYSAGEPIFLSDTGMPCKGICLEQALNDLCVEDKVARYDKCIYYRPFGQRLKGKSELPSDVVMHHMYVEHRGKVKGYYTGFTFANQIGLITQVPFALEIVTNNVKENFLMTELKGQRAFLYKPKTLITTQNRKVLQFLDLLDKIDLYVDQDEKALTTLERYVRDENVELEMTKKYLQLYPERVSNRLKHIFLNNLSTENT